jgi:hypothetical protein
MGLSHKIVKCGKNKAWKGKIYRKFQRVTGALLQFCWAHFTREVYYLSTMINTSRT